MDHLEPIEPTEAPVIWNLDEGRKVVAQIAAAVSDLGFRAQMVGSVAKNGESAKDLDVLVVPIEPDLTVDRVTGVIASIAKFYSLVQVHDDVHGFVDERKRLIEVWLGDVPQEIWGSEEYKAAINGVRTPSALEKVMRAIWSVEQELSHNQKQFIIEYLQDDE